MPVWSIWKKKPSIAISGGMVGARGYRETRSPAAARAARAGRGLHELEVFLDHLADQRIEGVLRRPAEHRARARCLAATRALLRRPVELRVADHVLLVVQADAVERVLRELADRVGRAAG